MNESGREKILNVKKGELEKGEEEKGQTAGNRVLSRHLAEANRDENSGRR